MTAGLRTSDSSIQEAATLTVLRTRYIQAIAIMALFGAGFALIFSLFFNPDETARNLTVVAGAILLSIMGLMLYLARRKQVLAAAVILNALFVGIVLFIPTRESAYAQTWFLPAVILSVITAATLGNRLIFAITFVLVEGLQIYLAVRDYSNGQNAFAPEVLNRIGLLFAAAVVGLATRFFINQAEKAADAARSSANLLQAVAETGEILAKMLNLNELLPRAVEMVRERFAFYHVQVFLLDEAGEYATLAASTGALGQKLMERRHRLAVGSQSFIGTVTARKEAVVARDTDPIYYRNELLPNTRSELAVPITDGDRIIGALDVQSRRPDAFDTEAVQAMQVMANLLGTSIRNARLFEQQTRSARETKRLFLEAETNLREIQRLNQQLTHQGWENYFQTRQDVRGVTLGEEQFVSESGWSDALVKASQTRQPVVVDEDGSGPIIAVPVMLGNEVIGAIEVEAGSDEQEAETLEMVKAVAQRLALSLDKARLFEESQEATAQEQRINEIAARYQTVTNVDELLKITLAELSDTLGARRGAIRLGSLQPEANGNGSRAHD